MPPGDEVYFRADTTRVPRALAAFVQEQQEGHRIIIIGGGNIGFNLAREIEKKSNVTARIIELDRDRARKVAERLPDTTVTHGDALAAEILEEAGINTADTVVAVTDDDETNIPVTRSAERRVGKECVRTSRSRW